MDRVEFEADGLTLVGDLRAPASGGPAPGLVFTGPFTGVRDQVTGLYAERLTRIRIRHACVRSSHLRRISR